MDYLHAFESCRSYNPADGSISRNDLSMLLNKFGLKFDSRKDPSFHDPQGRITFETFKHCYCRPYPEEYSTSPPPRSGSGNRVQRQPLHPSHHSRNTLKYVGSPKGYGGYDCDGYPLEEQRRPSYSREHNRTPEFMLSPDDPRSTRSRDRSRPQDLDHMNSDLRPHRDKVESPLPPTDPYHLRRVRPAPKSHHGDESEEEEAPFMSNHTSHSRRPGCKHCRKYQQQYTELLERNKRLEKELYAAQNTDFQYTNLMREHDKMKQDNERLRQELKKMNKGSEHDVDSRYLERQVEDLRKNRDDLEAEVLKKREVINDLKGYKKEYGSLRQKYEAQHRENWELKDEVQKLKFRVMELERGALIGSRRPGDGGSDDRPGELGFQRSPMRQTYHYGSGRGEVTRDSRPRKSGRVEMKRTSSAAQVLDYDEPQREDNAYSKAKSYRSGTYSDISSIADGLSLVTTTPDEQSQVFMVMGEDVSKSVLPDNLNNETELALIYALQNCHSPQEIIKCLVSYGIGTPGEQLQGYRVDNEHLKRQIDHLKSKNTVLAHSFENAKANVEGMYNHVQKVEANNTRLLHALRYCCQACEIYEVLLELRVPDRRMLRSDPHYIPSYDYSSLESSTRSPDREHHSSTSSSLGKPPAVLRARNLLHSLDSDAELQNFLPGSRSRSGTDFRHTSNAWGSVSQNTGTTSGLSSMSGGMEGDITPDELERLRLYTQALILRKNHFTDTLVPIEGVKGLQIVKDWELVKDCIPAGTGGNIMELEDAANAEELSKVREEKAELRSQIYMMDQEKRRMELEVARMLLHKQKNDKVIAELQFQLREEKRRRKREKKSARRGDGSFPPHDLQPLSTDPQSAFEREKEFAKRYDDLFQFLSHHTRESHSVSEDLMGFVKEMWQQNSSLVDAFEKAKKRQSLEKKRMKQELLSYMNQVHQGGSAPTNEEPSNGAAYP